MNNSQNLYEGKLLTCLKTGESVRLMKLIEKGGEATVWKTDLNSGCVAKLYQDPTPERRKKLEVMVANPPGNPTKEDNHISIAWPDRLLQDSSGAFVGFLMPHIRQGVTLDKVYRPEIRLGNGKEKGALPYLLCQTNY